jgi:hypothetical protein
LEGNLVLLPGYDGSHDLLVVLRRRLRGYDLLVLIVSQQIDAEADGLDGADGYGLIKHCRDIGRA